MLKISEFKNIIIAILDDSNRPSSLQENIQILILFRCNVSQNIPIRILFDNSFLLSLLCQ